MTNYKIPQLFFKKCTLFTDQKHVFTSEKEE